MAHAQEAAVRLLTQALQLPTTTAASPARAPTVQTSLGGIVQVCSPYQSQRPADERDGRAAGFRAMEAGTGLGSDRQTGRQADRQTGSLPFRVCIQTHLDMLHVEGAIAKDPPVLWQ
jgi:hypothetical protein